MTFIDDLNPEKFMVAGDWHGTLFQARAVIGLMQNIDKDNLKVVVQLGDFMYNDMRFLKGLNNELEKLDMWLLWVDGNHEDFNYLYSVPLHADGYRPLRSRIIHLPRGFRWKWGNLRFAALGGAHSVDKKMRTENKSWWPQEWVTDEELTTLTEGGQVDVLFMHDSPAGAPNRITDNPMRQLDAMRWFGQDMIDLATVHRHRLATAVNEVDPVMIMHGHYHETMRGTYTRPGGRECLVIGLADGAAGINKNTYLFDTEMQGYDLGIY